MTEPVLVYTKHEGGRIVVMRMNRPDRLNALNVELMDAIAEGWQRFADDDEAWVAILTGTGERAFCAGMDLRARAEADAAGKEVRPRRRSVFPLVDTLKLFKPTIAAVNGYALGGGFHMMLNCDVAIAAEHAEFGIPESRWNLAPPFPTTLTRLIGLRRTLELALWGARRIPAQRAYEIGLVNKVVPKEQLMDEAMSWAKEILELGPRAVWDLKESIYRTLHMEAPVAYGFAEGLGQNLKGMEDSVEGPKAFAERRKPEFKNA
ncbi:MAG: enoyl-CoA hydratase/isomerase family protein [Chloroflexi bacterium]|nr:enoyl-CoA hydratase/isomerase family protein [Chloroflexota bacterium]